MFGALALAGAGAAPPALAGAAVPRALLAMSACLALAFSVNRRHARMPRHPALVRGAWTAAAALMFAAIPDARARAGSGGIGAVSVGFLDIGVIAVALVALFALWAAGRIARGALADRGDRLLVGAFAGVVLFPAFWTSDFWWAGAGWSYPFWVLLGAALARANGNIKRP
jgi:hypothetical protein